MSMKKPSLWLTTLFAVALTVSPGITGERPDPTRWDEDIARVLERDKASPPKKGGILFIGSSGIKRWDTRKSFPERDILNRGFGGSMIQDSTHYAEKIVFPYAPRTIILYAGDNDISKGLTPTEVFEDYVSFAEKVRARLPETHLVFIAIKPSLKRWHLWPKMKTANDRIAERCAEKPREHFADIAPLLLGPDDKPDSKYFVEDELHLSEEGYTAWTQLLESLLEQLAQESS